MNGIMPFRTIEFSDDELLGDMRVTVTLQDGSKQYGLFTNLAFPTGRITIKNPCTGR